MVVTQEARADCGAMVVQFDGINAAARRLVGVCEVVAGAECEGVVFAQDARAACGDLLIQLDSLNPAASSLVTVCQGVA